MTISDSDLQAEAAEWLVRLDAGTADEAAFAAWRAADPRRAVAFAQAQAAWEAVERTRVERRAPSAGLFSRRALLRAAGVAGPIVAVGGGAVVLAGRSRAWAATEIGDRRRFEARPGVTIELNTDSRIGWGRGGEICELWLEKGEAAVLVDGVRAGGALLHCGGRALLLIPGEYNMRIRGDGGVLTVVEGAARPRGGGPVVASGQTASLRPGAVAVAETTPATSQTIAAWRKGEVVFSGQMLAEAVAEYNRYLDRKLVIEDPAVGRLRIGGRFETVRPRSFLKALESGFDIVATAQGDAVVLRKKSTGR